MSYILDALKKSEAEANPDAAATLALNQRERSREQRRHYVLGGLIGVALLINAGVLVWLLRPTPVPAVQPAQTTTAANPVSAAPPSSTAPSTAPATATQPDTVANSATGAATSAAIATAAARAGTTAGNALPQPAPAPAPRTIGLDQLPAGVRNRFPTVDFSTHIYADDPELRAVVANGERLTEGQFLGELQLKRITEEGVEFDFEGYLVRVSVLDAWELP